LKRTFLGWDRPLVNLVADRLVQIRADMDFGGVLVVVSSGRGGRRLEAVLADVAAASGLPMIPPAVVTPEGMTSRMVPPPSRPFAGRMARQVAWVRAIRGTPGPAGALFPHAVDRAGRVAAAGMLARWAHELATGGLTFATVPADALADAPDTARARWAAAAELHAAYLADLDAAGLTDPAHHEREAVVNGTVAAPANVAHVVLAGVVDPPRKLRQIVGQLAVPVDVLVYAPAALAEGFAGDGTLVTAVWATRAIDLPAGAVRTVPRPADQAAAAFAAIARVGPVKSDAVTIAVTDERLVAHLRTAANDLEGVSIRYGGGDPVGRSRPAQLLALAADFLDGHRFTAFVPLVGHPDVEQYLNRGDGARLRDWRRLLDEHAARRPPDVLTDAHRGPDGWGPPPPADPRRPDASSRDDRPDLGWLYSRVCDLLDGLLDPSPAPPGAWAGPIDDVVVRVYDDRSWQLTNPAHLKVYAGCKALRDAASELAAPAVNDGSVAAADAVRTVLAVAGDQRIPPPAGDGSAVDVVRWLELLADDADHAVVVGFNDGLVPESAAGDALLTDSLRCRLGVTCDDERLARDAYVLSAVLASRPPGRVTVVAGKWSATGDPLLPSRLLFACEPATAAGRILAPADEPTPLVWRSKTGGVSRFPVGVAVPAGVPPIESLAVTSFKDYIASPQGFYLKHVLRLRTVDAGVPADLTAGECGNLAHDALQRFAALPAVSSTSRQQCCDALMAALDAAVANRFGGPPGGVPRFQVEMLRRRLERLADWQAAWAGDGWVTRWTEWEPIGPSGLVVDGTPAPLRGRIDRIDQHAATGEWAVFDYKTGSFKSPAEAHLTKKQWTDLQLPLYRHLAREVLGEAQPKLGYIALCDDLGQVGGHTAKWDAQALASADARAESVVRGVRRGDFSEPGDNPPDYGAFGHIFGVGLIGGGGADGTHASGE
jgi:ATP-dependent helicase/nuclease subunit B